MAQFIVITGTARSNREAQLNARFDVARDKALLLLPGRGDVRTRQDALLGEGAPGLWGASILDLAGFAERIVAESLAPVRRIGKLERRLLIEQAIQAEQTAIAGLLDTDTSNLSGLASHMLAMVMQLKQAAIEPDQFLAQLNKDGLLHPQDRALALVYAHYQEALKASGHFDVPGLYWAAEACCRESKPRALAGIDTFLLDGFDDFTPSELRLLESVVTTMRQVVVGLHHDTRPARIDAFAGPARTLHALHARFDVEAYRADEPPPTDEPGYVAEHLFWRDKPSRLASPSEGVSVIPCIDARHESETIAREIRALLDAGTPQARIAIALREGGAPLTTLLSTLTTMGVPARSTLRMSLASTRVGATLLAFLDVLPGWECDAVLDLLTQPALWPGGTAKESEAFTLLVRKAKVLAGEQEWDRQLTVLADALSNRPHVLANMEKMLANPVSAIEALRKRLATLRRWTARFPAEATGSHYLQAVGALVEEWRFESADDSPALAAFWRALGQMTRFAPTETVTREDFLRSLKRALTESDLPVTSTREGVLIAEPEFLRNRRFEHLFIAGMNEGIYPRSPALNVLYGRRDLDRLARAGVVLDDAGVSASRERLMFLRLFLESDGKVTLTWRLQKEQGREASPSPFLAEIEELLAHRPGVRRPAPAAEAIVPAVERVSSLRDAANCAALAGGGGAATLQKKLPQVALGLRVEQERWAEAPCGSHDGVLQDDALLARIAARFSPQRSFSAAQLETWLSCPFHFLQQRVMRIDDTPPFEGEIEPRTRGDILHRTLQLFHAEHVGKPLSSKVRDEAEAAMEQALRKALGASKRDLDCLPREIVAAERRYLSSVLRRYLEMAYAREDDAWRPAHFELAFGSARGEEEESSQPAFPAFTLVLDNGESIILSGRVDRIDLTATGGAARIIDYKSGAVPAASAIHGGTSIQLGIYALALEEGILPGTTCEEAYYVPVGKGNWREALGKNPTREKEKWAQREPNMRASIANAVTAIRAGHFPPLPAGKECHGCGYAKACRRSEARQARKVDSYRVAAQVEDEDEAEFE